ncbi:NfeD family protein [Campylobacter sp. RM16187]|uniref:NfeD family protein n=1 Tax=Campylobacter sp. RM16187 TaxID=1660063 RepID=UPI0021B5D9DF|nr:NfeD family protein [Campylobacter sp. RM16187]QKG29009.1 putative slipin-associated protein (NfeD domain) [Campylobacter sp. RM16187]
MISPFLVLALGVFLIVAELLIGSFFIMFFGLGFLIVGVFGFFIDMLWYHQILLAAIISVILLFTLKKPIKDKFYNSKNEVKDDFLNESGMGEVKEGKIYFKGTLWSYDGELKDGEKVQVIGTKGNKVILK